jgi:hypothetical protein
MNKATTSCIMTILHPHISWVNHRMSSGPVGEMGIAQDSCSAGLLARVQGLFELPQTDVEYSFVPRSLSRLYAASHIGAKSRAPVVPTPAMKLFISKSTKYVFNFNIMVFCLRLWRKFDTARAVSAPHTANQQTASSSTTAGNRILWLLVIDLQVSCMSAGFSSPFTGNSTLVGLWTRPNIAIHSAIPMPHVRLTTSIGRRFVFAQFIACCSVK